MNRLSFLVLTLFAAYCLCDGGAANIEQVTPVILGGETIMDPNDPKYMGLAEESLDQYLRKIGSTEKYEIFKILKVTFQVVAGTNTRLIFTAAPSYCSTVTDGEQCKPDMMGLLVCCSKIFEQSWTNIRQVDVDCYAN